MAEDREELQLHMIRAQALDTPMWKLKLWWPKVKGKLMKAGGGDMEAFPKLQKAQDTLKPRETFRGVKLLQGWLIVQNQMGAKVQLTT